MYLNIGLTPSRIGWEVTDMKCGILVEATKEKCRTCQYSNLEDCPTGSLIAWGELK